VPDGMKTTEVGDLRQAIGSAFRAVVIPLKRH
jgi:hypothetical protein